MQQYQDFDKTVDAPTTAKVVMPNRAARRAKVDKPQPTNVVGKAHRNNRKNTKARKNNKLFLKLAEFEMSVGAKRHR